jgi:Uncharacterized protein conserved in bacteria C-term(DUF2220)
VSEAGKRGPRHGVPLLISELEGRVEVYLHNVPRGIAAVTVPRPGSAGPRTPRDRKQRLNPREVDLIARKPVAAFQPPKDLTAADLIKVLRTRAFKQWSTIEAEFGDRAWDLTVILVRAGAVALRCDVVDRLNYAPKSWRLTEAWAELAQDHLDELRGRPDPDLRRAELVQLMNEVPQLAQEREWLKSIPDGAPLVPPRQTAVNTDRWTVYETAIRAARVWLPHSGTERRFTVKELSALAFNNSKKKWTAPQCLGFANLVDAPFDRAIDQTETEIRLSGPLSWYMNGVVADAAHSRPWIGLPANSVRLIGTLECSATGVLLVENSDTFEAVCTKTVVNERWLCIWGKGYASPGLVALLQTFTSIPLAIWGDLDAHGINIIVDLIDRVGRHIVPVAMDVDAYRTGKKYFQEDKKRAENLDLARHLVTSAPAELRQLAAAIIKAGGDGCEQETLYESMLPELPSRLDQIRCGSDPVIRHPST